jgi:sulfatase maturation enzyme AslB (radical SAM superfamily)
MTRSARSPFVHFLPIGDGGAIFHSLTLRVLLGPRGMLESCIQRGAPLPDELGELFPGDGPEAALLGSMRASAARNSWAMGCIFLHFGCSSGCLYCHLRGIPPSAMTEPEVRAAVADFSARVLSSGRRSADLLLFGGEPFLRPDLVDAVLESLPSDPVINLSISTCGAGVEKGIAARLAGAGAFAIVSMDGGPPVQRRVRPSRTGDSYEAAAGAFRLLREAGCRVGISVTVSRWNIDGLEESFGRMLEEFRPDDIGLNGWLHPAPGSSRAPGQVGWERLLESHTRCIRTAVEKGVYVEQAFRRLRPFATAVPRLKDCAAAGGRLVYVPGGVRGRCDCMSAAGIDLESLSIDPSASSYSIPSDFSPVGRPGCLACPCLCLCGGGCRYDAMCATGSPVGVLEDRCRFERGFLEWMLLRLDSACGSPGARGALHEPGPEERLAVAGPAATAWMGSAPMPDASVYSERPC